MCKMEFTINDLNISERFSFIKEDFKNIILFIELEDDKIYDYLSNGTPIDLLCKIGFVSYDKRYICGWIDVIDEVIKVKKYMRYTDNEHELYSDFHAVFENACVNKYLKFEDEISRRFTMRTSQYYLNTNTGEITKNHRQAVEWYRQGVDVEIYKNNKKVLVWEV